MDQGVIHSFKAKFRTHLLREKLEAIDECSEIPKVDMLSAINKIKKAWSEVKCKTIKNCFKKVVSTAMIMKLK